MRVGVDNSVEGWPSILKEFHPETSSFSVKQELKKMGNCS